MALMCCSNHPNRTSKGRQRKWAAVDRWKLEMGSTPVRIQRSPRRVQFEHIDTPHLEIDPPRVEVEPPAARRIRQALQMYLLVCVDQDTRIDSVYTN